MILLDNEGAGRCFKLHTQLSTVNTLLKMETFLHSLELDIESHSITMLSNMKAILPFRNVNRFFFFFTFYLLRIM